MLQEVPLDDPVETWQAVESSFYETPPEPRWRLLLQSLRLPRLDRILAALIVTFIVVFMVTLFVVAMLNN